MSETTPTPPHVGDKVVYAPDPNRVGDPRSAWHSVWQERTRTPSLVIDGPGVGDDRYHMYLPSDGDGEWFAPAERLRVVERASYSPPGQPDAQARLHAAHDALTRITDADDDAFTTLESTVEYVVRSYRKIADEADEADAERIQLRHLLVAFVDPYPCRYDHHGHCQEHGHLASDRCPHARAKELLGHA